TGVAPAWMMAFAVAQNVSGVVMTSSPAPMPAASSDRCSAAVHEFSAIACGAPIHAANAASNAATRGPVVSQPDSSVATTSAISASLSDGRASATNPVPVVVTDISVGGCGTVRQRGQAGEERFAPAERRLEIELEDVG